MARMRPSGKQVTDFSTAANIAGATSIEELAQVVEKEVYELWSVTQRLHDKIESLEKHIIDNGVAEDSNFPNPRQ